MKSFSILVLLLFCFDKGHSQIFVKQDATGALDGSSWANAYTDLQNALEISNPGDQIWVAAGTYIPNGISPDDRHFTVTNPVYLYGGFAGSEISLDQRDWQTNLTIISGDVNRDDIPDNFITNRSDNARHVFIIKDVQGESKLDGLIFESGTTRMDNPGSNAYDWSGGAVVVYNSNALIRNCVFQQNDAWRGSGVYAYGGWQDSLSLIIEDCTFQNNNCFNFGASFLQAWKSLTVQRCDFKENSGYQSSSLYLSGSHAVVNDCVFENNFAYYGGACMSFQGSSSLLDQMHLAFNRCDFLNNRVNYLGGAFFLNNSHNDFTLDFTDCTFHNNTAGGGGAIEVADIKDTDETEVSSRFKITNSNFTKNSGVLGGVLQIEALDDSLRIEIVNSDFSNNIAIDGEGGAFRVFAQDQALVSFNCIHSVFDRDSAKFGGAGIILSYQTVFPVEYNLDSCTFKHNVATNLGGALYNESNTGFIRNSNFINNECEGGAGALISNSESLRIEGCHFDGNSTSGTLFPEYNGGGAILTAGYPGYEAELDIKNSIFSHNESADQGAAIFSYGKEDNGVHIENTLFHDNSGNSTVYNGGNMELLNCTMAHNASGLFLPDSTRTEIQNSIFSNTGENLAFIGAPAVVTKGANISSDDSMSHLLTGSGNYADFNQTDPMLGPDFIPVSGSPCIDAGNPDGIQSTVDLAGNPRTQGAGIDIGAYESFTVAVHTAIWNDPHVRIYPNPASEFFIAALDSDRMGDMQLSLYNTQGQLVNRKKVNKTIQREVFREDVKFLTPGEYFLIIKTADNTYADKILVQR